MSKFGNELIKSLTEAVDHAEGKANGAWVQVVNVINVRADPELTIRRHCAIKRKRYNKPFQQCPAWPPEPSPPPCEP